MGHGYVMSVVCNVFQHLCASYNAAGLCTPESPLVILRAVETPAPYDARREARQWPIISNNSTTECIRMELLHRCKSCTYLRAAVINVPVTPAK